MTRKRHRFAQRRRACGYSQEEFAEAVGVERTTVARWETTETEPQPWHRRRIAKVLQVSIKELADLLADFVDAEHDRQVSPDDAIGSPSDEGAADLRERLLNAAAVDDHVVALLASQADRIREFDRMLGARAAASQLDGHLTTLELLRTFTVSARQREPLADLYADAAALAGWQCLDLGDLLMAWRRHEAAKDAGRECRSLAALVHAMAQQAYVLVELGEPGVALELAECARATAGTAVPPLLSSWLSAVQGELHAEAGHARACRSAFESAERLLPEDSHDPELPYIVLDPIHLARWRGNALARLGDAAATADLRRALDGLDASFTRARAALHVDLAYALLAADRRGEAEAELGEAKTLATRVGSARQRRRIRRLESVLQTA